MTGETKGDLDRELEQQETHLARLQTEVEAAQARIAELKRRRTQHAAPAPASSLTRPSPRSPAAKVELFKELFRGRQDVFPRYWENRQRDRKGYSPACDNEWAHGLCDKRRGVKCGDCSNQAFTPVSDRVIVDHLQGRHVIGVYPMLEDDTTWFLAADFDKGSWRDDVAALRDTCDRLGVPTAVERSRSGDGAHAWFFFASPVSAATARQLGCYLITETMSRRHELPMTSYDRLFPNQDTMPRGGFGNLIALPLQHAARQKGNTVFVDDRLEPYPDQWGFLASCRRFTPLEVEQLAREANRTGRVIGVRRADLAEDDDEKPWLRRPSRKVVPPKIEGPLPKCVKVTRSQLLFVEKDGLPAPLLDRIKRLAAFQNPEFYRKQAMRLPTTQTPRVITCAEDHSRHVAIPRGCLPELEQLLTGLNVAVDLDDKRVEGDHLDVNFHGELAPEQAEAAGAVLAHDEGVFVAPPGTGKTVVGSFIIAGRQRSTLVLVHRTQILDQWCAQLAVFLDLDPKEVGQIGNGKRKPNGRLDVAMLQSLAKKDGVADLVAGYGHVVVDECHHIPAFSFERVMKTATGSSSTMWSRPSSRDDHPSSSPNAKTTCMTLLRSSRGWRATSSFYRAA